MVFSFSWNNLRPLAWRSSSAPAPMQEGLAAGPGRHFRGDHLILINKEASSLDPEATLILRGPIGEILAQVEG